MSKIGMFFVTLELLWCGWGLVGWATSGRPEWLFGSILALSLAGLIFLQDRRK